MKWSRRVEPPPIEHNNVSKVTFTGKEAACLPKNITNGVPRNVAAAVVRESIFTSLTDLESGPSYTVFHLPTDLSDSADMHRECKLKRGKLLNNASWGVFVALNSFIHCRDICLRSHFLLNIRNIVVDSVYPGLLLFVFVLRTRAD